MRIPTAAIMSSAPLPLLTCLMSAGPDRTQLRDCIANWRGKLFGVRGDVYFDKTGQLIQQPVVVEVRSGAFRLLRSVN